MNVTQRSKSRTIIDCDPGLDDAIALMLAFGALEELDILGVTTVGGNVGIELTQRNAQMVERAVTQAVHLEQRASTLAQAVEAFRLQQGTADEALALMARAVQYRQQTSRDSFLRDLTDPQQGFSDRDMYVFALDRNGVYVAFGGNAAKVGTRVQDIAGIDGQGLIDAIVAQASHEPGWVEYDITNPATGTVQTKMSYVQQVDDVFVGCGVYKNLVAH